LSGRPSWPGGGAGEGAGRCSSGADSSAPFAEASAEASERTGGRQEGWGAGRGLLSERRCAADAAGPAEAQGEAAPGVAGEFRVTLVGIEVTYEITASGFVQVCGARWPPGVSQ